MIVCCGENVMDMIKGTDGAYHPVAGGSSLNIAISIGRFGVPVGYAMPISNDVLGDALYAALERDNVCYLPLVRPARATGLTVVSVLPDGQPVYSFYRHNAADTNLQPGELPQLGAAVRHVQIGGSPALGLDGCGDMLLEWLAAIPAEVTLSLDPNVRPALIENKQRFLARCDRIISRGDICRLSQEDADYMYGTTEVDELVELLLSKGAGLVAVTQGASGACLATATAQVHVSCVLPGEMQDTIAAGDTFMAGLLTQLYLGDMCNSKVIAELSAAKLQELGDFAATAAAFNCMHKGCNPPRIAQVEQLLGARNT